MREIHATEGFFFSEDRARVVLCKKNRPIELAGKWLGVGGKLEVGETPYGAMMREFWEEAGVLTPHWEYILTREWHASFSGVPAIVKIEVFRAFGDVTKVFTKTDEEVGDFYVDALPDVKHDIRWLIPLVLDDAALNSKRIVTIHKKEDAICRS